MTFRSIVGIGVLCLIPFTNSAWAQTLELQLEERLYELTLEKNQALEAKLNATVLAQSKNDAKASEWSHYKAYLGSDSLGSDKQNWLRVSRIDGNWLGIASIEKRLYTIDSQTNKLVTGQKQNSSRERVRLKLIPLADTMRPYQCAAQALAPAKGALAKVDAQTQIQAQTLTQTQTLLPLATIRYQKSAQKSVCSDPLNGVCSFAEIEFAFDQLYQARFASGQLAAQTSALINMIEGFYENDFNIRFNAITVEFLQSTVFDTTTDAGDLLTDIRSKKASGQLGFIQNNQSLFHFITGRDFDGNTAGVAYVDVLCNGNGFSSGTTMLLPSSGTPNLASTSLIAAHEVGHNFGASHDGDGNSCPSSGFIMAASSNGTATEFSTCSKDDMNAAVNALGNPSACFDYPVELSIAADGANPTNLVIDEASDLNYSVATQVSSSGNLNQLSLSGTIPANSGRLNSVVAAGVACSIDAAMESYSCQVNNPTSSVSLQLNVTPLATAFELEQEVTAPADLVDIDPSNNSLKSEFTFTQVSLPAAVTNLSASESGANVALTWQDNAANETGFKIERSQNGGGFSQIADLAANQTSYTDTNVSAGNDYSYRVIAYNSAGDAAASNQANISLAAAPVTPPPGGSGGGSSGGGGGAIHWLLLAVMVIFGATRSTVYRKRKLL